MPAKIVSLNQYRKAKKKAEKERQAASNRERFGRTKDEKRRDADAASRTARDLDGKRLGDVSVDDGKS